MSRGRVAWDFTPESRRTSHSGVGMGGGDRSVVTHPRSSRPPGRTGPPASPRRRAVARPAAPRPAAAAHALLLIGGRLHDPTLDDGRRLDHTFLLVGGRLHDPPLHHRRLLDHPRLHQRGGPDIGPLDDRGRRIDVPGPCHDHRGGRHQDGRRIDDAIAPAERPRPEWAPTTSPPRIGLRGSGPQDFDDPYGAQYGQSFQVESHGFSPSGRLFHLVSKRSAYVPTASPTLRQVTAERGRTETCCMTEGREARPTMAQRSCTERAGPSAVGFTNRSSDRYRRPGRESSARLRRFPETPTHPSASRRPDF